MTFDRITARAGTWQTKWASAERVMGPPGPDALPMWIADMDFDVAPVIAEAAQRLSTSGMLGYFTGADALSESVAAWMTSRHGWEADPDHVSHTHGLGNGIALCLQAFSEPGDAVIIFSPVYHEFAMKIRRNEREVRESPLLVAGDGRFALDLDRLEQSLTGTERIMLISSPHNPAGRIWTPEEQRAMADFCARHDLILLSDEIHHDLVFPGERHVPMPVAAPDSLDRLVMLTAASKTFNIAGCRTGSITIADETLRARFRKVLHALDIQPNIYGVELTRAAYTPEGAAWCDELCAYLAENARRFSEGVAAIPGLSAMPMQSTYLAWVDFSPLGMSWEEVRRRIVEEARLGPSPGPSFGTGGDCAMRFNLGTQRIRIDEAVSRLQDAFADVQ
ncbi:MalY/PatB family protein [Histidinibacterium lentulum]|uniref:cysteine-S-conjugate beta-lyase n=1 Tax=Histidinibacterium lentulum TaxID=2480588 RepID=A0A3N2R5E9_9RHOB|nr:PatB family C-S lyase [Histidinibacterium lentulum]ROU02725.1 putative C-S lyase [Histidinibacterium lentulum]